MTEENKLLKSKILVMTEENKLLKSKNLAMTKEKKLSISKNSDMIEENKRLKFINKSLRMTEGIDNLKSQNLKLKRVTVKEEIFQGVPDWTQARETSPVLGYVNLTSAYRILFDFYQSGSGVKGVPPVFIGSLYSLLN